MRIALFLFVALVVLWWLYLVVRLLLYSAQSLLRFVTQPRKLSPTKSNAALKTKSLSPVRAILENAVGPAPWYWQTFPTIIGSAGQQYVWAHQNSPTGRVFLAAESEPDKPRLAVGIYCRAFAMPPNRVGLWFPRDGKIHLACFNPDSLASFELSDIPADMEQQKRGFYARSQPLSEMTIPSNLASGAHAINIPPEFAGIESLLMIEARPAPNANDPFMAIFELRPHTKEIIVRPQSWFISERFDTGYQWITRVAHDSRGRIVGDGIRLGAFRLAENGCDLDCWLK